MSGPKSGDYHVVSAAELRRRQLAAATDRHARTVDGLRELRSAQLAAEAAYGQLSVTMPAAKRPSSDDPGAWDRASDSLTAAIASARGELEQAVREARLRQLSAGPARVTAVLVEEAPEPARASRPQQSAAGDALARVLARLPAAAPADVADRCTAMGREYMSAASPAAQARQLDAIRFAVQAEQDRQDRISGNDAILEQLYTQLDGLAGEQVQTMRGVLKGLDRAASLPGNLADRVAAVRAAAVAEQDREFVLSAAQSALAELGYAVGADFRTAVPASGALLDLPHSPGHGLRIRERNRQLMLNVIRFDADGLRDPVADQEAETSFCHDFARFRTALSGAGIDLDMVRADAPGQTPVQVLRESPATRQARQRAGSARQRERPA